MKSDVDVSRMVTILGVDPGVHDCGLGLIVVQNYRILDWGARLARNKSDSRWPQYGMIEALMDQIDEMVEPNMLAIEWQSARPGDKRPADITQLAGFAGLTLGALINHYGLSPNEVFCPLPVQWKGSIPKAIHQKRILTYLDATIDSPEFDDIPKSMRNHSIDGLGIAIWCAQQKRLLKP